MKINKKTFGKTCVVIWAITSGLVVAVPMGMLFCCILFVHVFVFVNAIIYIRGT
jgi:hypothetical protein